MTVVNGVLLQFAVESERNWVLDAFFTDTLVQTWLFFVVFGANFGLSVVFVTSFGLTQLVILQISVQSERSWVRALPFKGWIVHQLPGLHKKAQLIGVYVV